MASCALERVCTVLQAVELEPIGDFSEAPGEQGSSGLPGSAPVLAFSCTRVRRLYGLELATQAHT